MADLLARFGPRPRYRSDPMVSGRIVVNADVDRAKVTLAGEELDHFEVVGLIAELSRALIAVWPPLEAGWDRDPNREGLSGRIGQAGRRT